MKKQFDICVDDDCVDILDFINVHFKNGNWHKNFEVTVSLREIGYTEDGKRIYADEREFIVVFFNRFANQSQTWSVKARNKFHAGRLFYKKHDRKSYYECIELIEEITE